MADAKQADEMKLLLRFMRSVRKMVRDGAPKSDGKAADISGRLPAHDLAAEATCLCNAMERPAARDEIIDLLIPSHFYSDANGKIWEAIVALTQEGVNADAVAVAAWLRDRDRLAQIGGPGYLAQIVDSGAARTYIRRDAERVREKWRIREAVALCHRVVAEGYGDVGDPATWIDGIEAAIGELAHDAADAPVETAKEIAMRVWSELENKEAEHGIGTGLDDLDRVLGPIKKGQMVIIAAHPGIGKTAMGLGIAIHLANVPMGVAFFSLEMEREELVQRGIFTMARLNAARRWSNAFNAEEYQAINRGAQAVGRNNLWIDDRRGLTALQIRARARRIRADAAKRGIALGAIVVDYMQLVGGDAGNGRNFERREQELSQASKALRDLGGELGVPVFVLAQLNSDNEKRPDKRPKASDLRECKAIWMHADKVILIHNEHYAERSKTMRTGERARMDLPGERCELIVDKNRGAMTGSVPVIFWPSCTAFEDDTGQDAIRGDA